MSRPTMSVPVRLALAVALVLPAAAGAQMRSPGYTFLEAVRDADGTKVNEILNQPGQTIVNTRDRASGEGALHIVAKRADLTYLRFLLNRGANPNMQDARGNTPVMAAVERGFVEAIDPLKARGGNLNLANASGETPLIRAVQLRNVEMVRVLLAAGANADQADMVAGMSARDYARRDARSPALLKMIEAAPPAAKAKVAGPRL